MLGILGPNRPLLLELCPWNFLLPTLVRTWQRNADIRSVTIRSSSHRTAVFLSILLHNLRPVTGGEQEAFRPPGKMCWTWFKTIGHSLKNWAPQKTFCPTRCPKLVTGQHTLLIFRAIAFYTLFVTELRIVEIISRYSFRVRYTPWRSNNGILEVD